MIDSILRFDSILRSTSSIDASRREQHVAREWKQQKTASLKNTLTLLCDLQNSMGPLARLVSRSTSSTPNLSQNSLLSLSEALVRAVELALSKLYLL
jgi:hypothetical protein